MSDTEMLNKWLNNEKEKAFESGIEYACKRILSRCTAESMPVRLSDNDDTLYVSIDDVESILKEVQTNV